jgi:hypothetical protein
VVAIRWDRSAHLLGETFHQRRHPRLRTVSLRDVCREIYNSSDRFARIPDSAVGGMLSLGVLPVLGVCSLLLRKQLLDSRVRRYHAPGELADVGATGKHCRRVDVRNFREHFVRDRYPTRRRRKKVRIKDEHIKTRALSPSLVQTSITAEVVLSLSEALAA